MVKLFDEYGIQFVSVTQEINTATSSGRMMLNILMTFAQYEQEIISERTRDKLFMSRQKGMYTGGMTVLGYKAVNKKLEIVSEKAEIVKFIFRRYIEIQSPKHIARELNAQNITTKNGFKWNQNRVNVILNNYVCAWLLRRAADATGGILLFEYSTFNGKSLNAIAKVSKIIAKYEDFFRFGIREKVKIPNWKNENVQKISYQQKSILLLFNQDKKSLKFKNKIIPAGEVMVIENY